MTNDSRSDRALEEANDSCSERNRLREYRIEQITVRQLKESLVPSE